MSNWERFADSAAVDLAAARLKLVPKEALDHLKDALANLENSIEALEAELWGSDE